MSIDGGQLIAICLIGVALAIGVGLIYLSILLLKRTWTWVVGSRPRSQRQSEQTAPQELNPGSLHAARAMAVLTEPVHQGYLFVPEVLPVTKHYPMPGP